MENRPADAVPILRELHSHTGRAHIAGITGPPGAGKSTLIDVLVRLARRDGRRVGVVAVDPTSPFTGGAILGDRVRMQDHAGDPGVFVRSMATRGSLGGLAVAASGAVEVLDAFGCDLIFVETVGTGQAEVDIVRLADTVAVVTVPHLGDGVQAIKAGVMEIGDLFVVNKADQGDADRAATEIKMMLGLAGDRQGWRPPVLLVSAVDGTGVPAVLEELAGHRAYQEAHALLDQRRRRASAPGDPFDRRGTGETPAARGHRAGGARCAGGGGRERRVGSLHSRRLAYTGGGARLVHAAVSIGTASVPRHLAGGRRTWHHF